MDQILSSCKILVNGYKSSVLGLQLLMGDWNNRSKGNLMQNYYGI